MLEINNKCIFPFQQPSQGNESSCTGQKEQKKSIRNIAENWIQNQHSLTTYSNSGKFVVKIPDKNGKAIAFFKIDKYAGVIETIVSEISQILELQKHFTKTEWVVLKNQETGNETFKPRKAINIRKFTKNGLKIIAKVRFPLKGSLQPKQEGMRLLDYFFSSKKSSCDLIPRFEIISAGMIAWIFGMFDAHLANMFINEGKIIFFDNEKSFANSNSLLFREKKGYRSTFRCGLLDLSEAAEKWEVEEGQKLIEILTNCEKKFPVLMDYLEQKHVKQMIHSLPKGWFTYSTITAFKERIYLAKEAIQSGKVTRLIDLPIVCSPTYGISFAAEYLSGLISRQYSLEASYLEILKKTGIHSKIGYDFLDESLKQLKLQGYDIKKLIAIGCKEKTCCEEIIYQIKDLYLQNFKFTKKAQKLWTQISAANFTYLERTRSLPLYFKILKEQFSKNFHLKKVILATKRLISPLEKKISLEPHQKKRSGIPREYKSIKNLFVTMMSLDEAIKLCIEEVTIKTHVEWIISFFHEFLKQTRVPEEQISDILDQTFQEIECQLRLGNTEEVLSLIQNKAYKVIRKQTKQSQTKINIQKFFLSQVFRIDNKSTTNNI